MPYLPNLLDIDPSVFIAAAAVVIGERSVGTRSSVGYHSTLRGGMASVKPPPGSLLLGVMGRVVRPLRKQAIDRILHSAKQYVEYVQRYREGDLG